MTEEEKIMTKWRVGRRNPRIIYAQVGPEPDHDADEMIGTFDTPALARDAVKRHNQHWWHTKE